MTFKEFLQCIIEHKEYAPLYSSLISSLALIFSFVSFFISNIISKRRAEKDKAISNARYEEQKKKYEERLNEERIRREEDKQEMQERSRIREEPYLVFKKSEISSSDKKQIVIKMEFLNKGRGSAYEITPDVKCLAKTMDMEEFQLFRCGAIEDPIAMVGEILVLYWSYTDIDKNFFRMMPTIKFKDASGRNYKQTYCIDIIDINGNANIINYAQPELCE